MEQWETTKEMPRKEHVNNVRMVQMSVTRLTTYCHMNVAYYVMTSLYFCDESISWFWFANVFAISMLPFVDLLGFHIIKILCKFNVCILIKLIQTNSCNLINTHQFKSKIIQGKDTRDDALSLSVAIIPKLSFNLGSGDWATLITHVALWCIEGTYSVRTKSQVAHHMLLHCYLVLGQLEGTYQKWVFAVQISRVIS